MHDDKSDPAAIILRAFELTLSATLRALRLGRMRAIRVTQGHRAPQTVNYEGQRYRLGEETPGAVDAILQTEAEAMLKESQTMADLISICRELLAENERLGGLVKTAVEQNAVLRVLLSPLEQTAISHSVNPETGDLENVQTFKRHIGGAA